MRHWDYGKSKTLRPAPVRNPDGSFPQADVTPVTPVHQERTGKTKQDWADYLYRRGIPQEQKNIMTQPSKGTGGQESARRDMQGLMPGKWPWSARSKPASAPTYNSGDSTDEDKLESLNLEEQPSGCRR